MVTLMWIKNNKETLWIIRVTFEYINGLKDLHQKQKKQKNKIKKKVKKI